jgi:hypothetical protein
MTAELAGDLRTPGRVASTDENYPPLLRQLTRDVQAIPPVAPLTKAREALMRFHDPTTGSHGDGTGARRGRIRAHSRVPRAIVAARS